MKGLVHQSDAISELRRLLEIRRRQVICAFATGWAAGMCIIELLRVLKIIPEPIGWAIVGGFGLPIGVFSLIGSEIRIRKAVSHIVLEDTALQEWEQDCDPRAIE
jgi:hypothetical protein